MAPTLTPAGRLGLAVATGPVLQVASAIPRAPGRGCERSGGRRAPPPRSPLVGYGKVRPRLRPPPHSGRAPRMLRWIYELVGGRQLLKAHPTRRNRARCCRKARRPRATTHSLIVSLAKSDLNCFWLCCLLAAGFSPWCLFSEYTVVLPLGSAARFPNKAHSQSKSHKYHLNLLSP